MSEGTNFSYHIIESLNLLKAMSTTTQSLISEASKPLLRELQQLYPSTEATLAMLASLRASLVLPKETIHVISDIHGEFKKLRHVVNNASGSLRPIVESIFQKSLREDEIRDLLNIIHYPNETYAVLKEQLSDTALRHKRLTKLLTQQCDVMRVLASKCRMSTIEAVLPSNFKDLFRELLFAPLLGRSDKFYQEVVHQFMSLQKEVDLLRLTARMIRNLLVYELIVAGDMGDRGESIEKVISFLMKQPRVNITWGNHDVVWIGACLGHEACVATVIRLSLRYNRLAQLEEGYGISLTPLENLARTMYADDQATRFACKGTSSRDPKLMSQMQKAIAMIQFKVEGQLLQRNPEWQLGHRDILSSISADKTTVRIDGLDHALLDTNLPTVVPHSPLALTDEELHCLQQLCSSFVSSSTLWQQMKYLVKQGRMHLVRDRHLIFHGCVPCDAQGSFLPCSIGSRELSGRELYDELNRLVPRALRERRQEDVDVLWYLWSGPRSPLFGKDKMATFESYFIADKSTHHETKDAYFSLIHDVPFCEKVLQEFNVNAKDGIIINGHVPVKIEQGESPVKRSGKAITIDGAFSESYGDKGYSLVLEADRTYLAQHHHFDSIRDSISTGSDIIPSIQELSVSNPPRTIADTEEGVEIQQRIELLELLVKAYRENAL
jgi:fructose-1,6-bisphosphatase III